MINQMPEYRRILHRECNKKSNQCSVNFEYVSSGVQKNPIFTTHNFNPDKALVYKSMRDFDKNNLPKVGRVSAA